MENLVLKEIEKSTKIIEGFQAELQNKIPLITESIVDTIENEFKIIVFGFGSSSIIADYLSTRFLSSHIILRPSLPIINISCSTATLSSIEKNFSEKDIFLRQLQALANKGDLVIGISNDKNLDSVMNGLKYCVQNDIKTVGISNENAIALMGVSDILLSVKSNQEHLTNFAHILAMNIICDSVDKLLFG